MTPKEIKNFEFMGCDESVVIVSAVRYMLGRSSYGVGCVCDHVRVNAQRLTKGNICVITRDIQERIKKFPDTPFKDDWLSLVDFLSKPKFITKTKQH